MIDFASKTLLAVSLLIASSSLLACEDYDAHNIILEDKAAIDVTKPMEIITIYFNPRSDYNLTTLSNEIILDLQNQLTSEITQFTKEQTTSMADIYLENFYIQELVRKYTKTNG